MKTIKVNELSGVALDWLVAKCAGVVDRDGNPKVFRWTGSGRLSIRQEPYADTGYYHPSTDWSQGGPIIEREKISSTFQGIIHGEHWWATHGDPTDEETLGFTGPTPLIAAMRCYVASKLGESVEVPEELA